MGGFSWKACLKVFFLGLLIMFISFYFLKIRFNDINVDIRIECVKFSNRLLSININRPKLRQDVINALKLRQHDDRDSVRYFSFHCK